jgi:hypothetical protein
MRSMRPRCRWLSLLGAAVALALPSCSADGQLCLFGYTSAPNYDLSIRTVRVPIFENVTFRRGLEFDLTRAVIREIESKTPWKVVQDCEAADTELVGKIVSRSKAVTIFNQIGEIRDAETYLTVELVWRDLRPGHVGEILSGPRRGRPDEPPEALGPPPAQPPVLVQSIASFIPEVGQSLTSAEKVNVDRLATQIVSMMEKPW